MGTQGRLCLLIGCSSLCPFLDRGAASLRATAGDSRRTYALWLGHVSTRISRTGMGSSVWRVGEKDGAGGETPAYTLAGNNGSNDGIGEGTSSGGREKRGTAGQAVEGCAFPSQGG